jgi:NAD(P)-dependent dehydrogenase (short-subunit alcohol dehydrogenase family)
MPHTHQVDVSMADRASAAFSDSVEAFGRVDVLVNSAGITGPNATTCDYPLDLGLSPQPEGRFRAASTASPLKTFGHYRYHKHIKWVGMVIREPTSNSWCESPLHQHQRKIMDS